MRTLVDRWWRAVVTLGVIGLASQLPFMGVAGSCVLGFVGAFAYLRWIAHVNNTRSGARIDAMWREYHETTSRR